VKKSENRGQTALFAPDSCVFSNGCGARKRCLAPVFRFFHSFSARLYPFPRRRTRPTFGQFEVSWILSSVVFGATCKNRSLACNVHYSGCSVHYAWNTVETGSGCNVTCAGERTVRSLGKWIKSSSAGVKKSPAGEPACPTQFRSEVGQTVSSAGPPGIQFHTFSSIGRQAFVRNHNLRLC